MPDVLGSVPASEESPRVVVFRAHWAQKTSEFLDLIEQTNVVRLDTDRFVESSIFHGKKAEEPKKESFAPPSLVDDKVC
jgi:hypothetical protein